MKSMRLSLSEMVFPNLYGRETDPIVEPVVDPVGGTDPIVDPATDPNLDPQKKIVALTEEKDRHFQARQKAEEELTQLRAFKDEAERKTRTETENLQKDLQQRDEVIKGLEAANKGLAVEIAFYNEREYEWHNPKRALSALDLSAVEIDKNGVVANPAVLKEAIKKLATEEAWMLKANAGGGDPKPPLPGTGTPPANNGSNSKQKNAEAERARLAEKYPALRQH